MPPRHCAFLAVLLVPLLGTPAAPAQSNNAAPVYRQAFALMGERAYAAGGERAISDDDWNFINDLRPIMSAEQRARAEQILLRAQPAIEMITEGSRLRKCDWELDKTKGFELLLPHLSSMRNAARLLRVKSMLASNDVDRAAALESVAALGRLSAHSGQDAVLISSLVGSAIGSLAVQNASLAIEAGAVDSSNAEQLLQQLSAFKVPDPFRYGQAVSGEFAMLQAQMKGEGGLDAMLRDLGASPEDRKSIGTPEQAAAEMRQVKGLYDRVAGAFQNPDPEAARRELRQVEQMVESGRGGLLARLVMPSFLRAYESKMRSQAEMLALMARLQSIADGKATSKELLNAALLLARASSAARALPEDAQDVIELVRVAPAAVDGAAAERAASLLERAQGSIIAPLRQAADLQRCDFRILRMSEPSLDAQLLSGVRAATRVALASALRNARAAGNPSPAVQPLLAAFRTAALVASDPSLARSQVAQSIWAESAAALKEVRALGAFTEEQQAALNTALATMPSGDPFQWRKAWEADIARIVEWNRGGRSGGATPEATELRTRILRQRGASAALARIALVEVVHGGEDLPDAKAPTLCRMTDLWSAEGLRAVADAAEQIRKRSESSQGEGALGVQEFDVPYDLPIEEQKEKFRKLDPARGIVLADLAALQSKAAEEFVRPFESLK